MASRERTLFLEAEVSGRLFCFENETLELVGEKEPEVITAYFAEKVIKYPEETHEDTFSYTFKNDTELKTAAQKTNIANIIRGKLTFDGDKKYTNNQKIIAAFTKETHKKDDEITIVALKKEKKEYYKKITGAPMGYHVYLVAETKKLDGKTLKIKIQESESPDQDKKKVLKLVKADTDVLPVLVFAKLEDKTTTTEISDWIEIDIKKQDGKIINKTAGTDIEVGIKKIQLRPKEAKIKTKGEDAIKSYQGWQEALYIRYDETEAGKKAIKDAEDAKTARDAEALTTLTRDADADKKENKKSFPKTISGPKTIEIDKVAVYKIDTYNTNATKADKNNIRWSIWITGDKKTDYKIIDTKSKAGLYSYAKMELIGDNNQLTIVFDKALKGKKIQIEPFRGVPDIDQSKKSYDYIKSTTIKEPATPKITIRDKAHLYLKTQCDSIENSDEKIDKEFLKSAAFKLETPNTIHIYYDGKMSKLNLEGLKKVKYVYHDNNGDSHLISTNDLVVIKEKSVGKSVSSFRTETASKIIDYASKNVAGVDAKTSRIYSNGDVITDGKKYGQPHYKIEYKSLSDEVILVHMKTINRTQKPKMKFHFHETLREYSNPYYFGAFIGALAEVEFDVSCGGSCYEDGSAFPSLEHSNGFAIDTGYKYTKASDEKIIKAMKKFGFTKRIRGSTTYLDTLSGHTKRDSGNLHDTHLHCGKLTVNEK